MEKIRQMKDEELIRVVPSSRQLVLQEMEFYAFVHFTVNTFTGREWGDGSESPSVFAPPALDADQWARAGALRLTIDDARVRPTLRFIGVYSEAE